VGFDQKAKLISGSCDGLLTRRGLLKRAAWILPASVFLDSWEAAAQDVSPVMVKLSSYMAEARNMELPDKVMQDARFHILDTVAAMISGSELLRVATRSSSLRITAVAGRSRRLLPQRLSADRWTRLS
jgi:hypothetical protein